MEAELTPDQLRDALKKARDKNAQYRKGLNHWRSAFINQAIAAVPENKRGLIPTDYDEHRLAHWLSKNLDVLTKSDV